MLVALGVLVGGCGDPIKQPDAARWTPPAVVGPQWTDRIDVDRDSGALGAPGFNAVIEAEAPDWAKAADTTVAELLDLNQGFDGPVEIYLLQEDQVLTVTLARLGDDSIEAIRYRISLHRGDDGRFRFVSGERTQRCRSGRGHADFDVSRCS